MAKAILCSNNQRAKLRLRPAAILVISGLTLMSCANTSNSLSQATPKDAIACTAEVVLLNAIGQRKLTQAEGQALVRTGQEASDSNIRKWTIALTDSASRQDRAGINHAIAEIANVCHQLGLL